jgi:hypothetical protein
MDTGFSDVFAILDAVPANQEPDTNEIAGAMTQAIG